MDLRNWEFYDSGNALVGATVKVRDAVLTHPNTGTILATTTTDSNGMWAFTGLSETAKDVEVIWGNASQYHKWYKGLTRHTTGQFAFTEDISMPANSIITADIAANAVTKTTSTNTNGTTTSATLALIGANHTLNFTASGGVCFFSFACSVSQSSATGLQQVTFRLDGGADNYIHYETFASGDTGSRGGEYVLNGGATLTGAHAVAVYFATSAGSFLISPLVYRVREYLR